MKVLTLRSTSRLVLAAVLLATAAPLWGAVVPRSLSSLPQGGSAEVFVWMKPAAAAGEPAKRRAAKRMRQSLAAAMPPAHVEVRQTYRTLPALVVRADAEGIAALASHPDVAAIAPMEFGTAALAESVPQIGAAELHDRGLRGLGSVLALLDTGIDGGHPDLAGRIDGEECICHADECTCDATNRCTCTRCCPDKTVRQSGPGSAQSASFHGPHVAGILASAGVVSSPGVAPEARVFAIRVLNDQSSGALSDWVAGLDLILDEHPTIVAVNMSLVSTKLYTPPCDLADAFTLAFSDVVERLRLRGTIVVAAAGNNGGDELAIGKLPLPACLSDVVSVGAVNESDGIASFSNVAPGLDLLAPGVGIVSDGSEGDTVTASGTSMAAPHVTASLGLLLPLIGRPFIAAAPGVLKNTGLPIVDERLCDHGRCSRFPRVDVAAAADWLGGVNALYMGGGSKLIDCQAEWRVEVPPTLEGYRSGKLRCRDGDPACDNDSVAGQCTFRVQACFNVPDRRLLTCDPLQTVTAYRLVKPSLSAPRDPLELENAVRILGSMPSLPISDGGQCGSEFDYVVPVGAGRSLKLATETIRGRDLDALRFRCLPSVSPPS